MFSAAMARRSLLIAAMLLALPVRAERIDAIVSVVGDRVVTLSDIGFEETFSAHDRSPVLPFAAGALDPLQRLEDYRILRALAGDVAVFQPADAAVTARMEDFRASWSLRRDYELFLARWGMGEDDLRDQIYGRMVVEQYVLRNLGAEVMVGADPARAMDRYEAWMARRRADTPARRVGDVP